MLLRKQRCERSTIDLYNTCKCFTPERFCHHREKVEINFFQNMMHSEMLNAEMNSILHLSKRGLEDLSLPKVDQVTPSRN